MDDSLIVTPYQPSDRDAVLDLVPRLTLGVAAWRPTGGVDRAVPGWFEESVNARDDGQATFVARSDGEVVGMVAVSEQRHWSGDLDGVHRRAGHSRRPGETRDRARIAGSGRAVGGGCRAHPDHARDGRRERGCKGPSTAPSVISRRRSGSRTCSRIVEAIRVVVVVGARFFPLRVSGVGGTRVFGRGG
jgi:hypothetical protein